MVQSGQVTGTAWFSQVRLQGQHGSGRSGYRDSMVQAGQVTGTAWFSQVRSQGQHGTVRSGHRDSMVQAGQFTETAWFSDPICIVILSAHSSIYLKVEDYKTKTHGDIKYMQDKKKEP